MDSALLCATAILFVAAYLQSATGFGGAIVCMAVLPLFIDVRDAVSFVSIASVAVTLMVVAANRSGLSLRNAVPLCLGMVLGIPIGYFALRQIEGGLVIRLLGIVLMLLSATEFLQNRFSNLAIPEKTGTLFGFVGGILAGAFNVGGPPVVAYAYSRNWSKVEIVAILQTVFIAGATTRNILMASTGEYTARLFQLVGWALPGAVLAVWLGKLTLDRVPQPLLRKIVFSLIFLIGLRYLAFG
jgi:uncharacterized membrane protein YfcA